MPVDRDDQRDGVGRVRGVGRAVGLEHVLGVAVVGGDDAGAAGLVDGGDDPGEAGVDGLDRAHGGRDRARVPDHVGVGEVDDPEAESSADHAVDRTRRQPRRRSSRACDRRWRRPAASRRAGAPPRPLRLAPAVEEVRDVRVLLGLGDVELPAARLADHLGHRRLRRGRRERDRVTPTRRGSWPSS